MAEIENELFILYSNEKFKVSPNFANPALSFEKFELPKLLIGKDGPAENEIIFFFVWQSANEHKNMEKIKIRILFCIFE